MSEPVYSRMTGAVVPEMGWVPPFRYLLRRSRILSLLRTVPRGALLEIGCGAGALLCDLGRMGFVVQGLETSAEARAQAERVAKCTLSDHEIHSVPQASWDSGFDFVCAFDVLEHIEDDRGALELWLRWLKPEGSLLLSVPAHRSRWGAGDEWAGHWRRYDRHDIQRLVRSCGLEIFHLECYGFPLANLTEWAGNRIYRKLIRQRGEISKNQASAASGVDRRSYVSLSRVITSVPGKILVSMAFALQNATENVDWGSGYLLLAKRS